VSQTISVLGTGMMGTPLARNLLRAGYSVRVWNRTSAKMEALAGLGATRCSTPAEAVRGAEFVLTMLADGMVTEQVMTGSDGGLETMAPGSVWLQMGTMGFSACIHLAALAAQEGVLFVDAPVVGTAAPAERRELVVMASGPESCASRCRPVFDALARRTLWVGPAGHGQLLKLVVNKWILDIFGSLAESVALAESLGVSPGDFLSALEDGPVGVPSARVRGEAMMARDFSHTSFSIDLAHKDVELNLDAAGESGCELAITRAVERQLAASMAMGLGGKDLAAVFLSLPHHHKGTSNQ
jgi:3-hydroxyisobutyrate dehydrogenase